MGGWGQNELIHFDVWGGTMYYTFPDVITLLQIPSFPARSDDVKKNKYARLTMAPFKWRTHMLVLSPYLGAPERGNKHVRRLDVSVPQRPSKTKEMGCQCFGGFPSESASKIV